MIKNLSRAFIGIGSNLGERIENIRRAIEKIKDIEAVRVLKTSPIYETTPHGYVSKNLFLNAVIEIEVFLAPKELLRELLSIEKSLGRTRKHFSYEDRAIDLDILLYDDLIFNSEELIIPHPEISKRLFVLAPLKDLCKDLKIPGLTSDVSRLYQKAIKEKANDDNILRVFEFV